MSTPNVTSPAAAEFSEPAREYFRAHAIDPIVAQRVGVSERAGALIYSCEDGDGKFERRRPLAGERKQKTLQPRRPLALWWPAGRPARARRVLVCEGEPDALAALSAIAAETSARAAAAVLGDLAVVAVPGTGFPVKRLAEQLQAIGAERALLASDSDESGDEYAAKAAVALDGVGISAMRLPLAEGADLADCLVRDHDPSGWLAGLIADTEALAEEHAAEKQTATPDDAPPVANDAGAKGPGKAELVKLAQEGGEFFHDPERRPWATVPVADHLETMALDSRDFAHWLGHLAHTHGGASQQSIKDATATLEAHARYAGGEHAVYTRLATREGAAYLDLGDPAWRAVEITTSGWTVMSGEPPVKFRRPPSMRALPEPAREGSVEALRHLVHVSDEHWPLVVGWLVGCLSPTGPYPLLVLHGEQGSGKSTTAKLLRSVIDPARPDHRGLPENERDLMIAATNSRILAFDNLSGLGGRGNAWVSDALCRLSTGGGYATRALYSNDEEQLFEVQRPVILNGIDALPQRSDLLSRSLLVELPRLPEDQVRTDRDLWRCFQGLLPLILGGLLDAAAASLANLDSIKLSTLPRMADHVVWVAAAESALGWAPGTYQASYASSRQDATDAALEASPLSPYLEAVADGNRRTATELHEQLEQLAGESVTKQRGWPSNATQLSSHLKRLAPDLRRIGIEVDRASEGRGGSRRKTICLRRDPRTSDPSDPSDPTALQSQIAGSHGVAQPTTGSLDGVAWGRMGSLNGTGETPENTGMGSLGSLGSLSPEKEEKEKDE